MDEAAVRKREALRKVEDAVGRRLSPPGRGGATTLPSGRRLLLAYGHEHARAHGEAGFSVGIPNRLPSADFLLLLLGDDDLVVPTEVFTRHWEEGSQSGDSRPTPIIRRRAREAGFYAQFGRDGAIEDLTQYIGGYSRLA